MSRRYLRPEALAGHVLVLIAVLVCLRLGWWQWNVAHETRGTIQNLGYALLWPVFGGAFIFMWLRFLYLEDERRADQHEPADLPGTYDVVAADAPTLEHPLGAERGDAAPAGEPVGHQAVGEGPTAPTAPAGSGSSDAPAGELPTALDPSVDSVEVAGDSDPGDRQVEKPTRGRRTHPPSTAVTIAVATVGADDDDDPELTAYNAALARLAEQDNRRAR